MSAPPVTELLQAARAGDTDAFDRLYGIVYDELRRIAHLRLRRHRRSDTLNTTALVHEAYLKLADQAEVAWNDRNHFFAVASRAMRFILIDYARKQNAQRRGGPQRDLPLDDLQVGTDEHTTQLLALHQALEALEAVSERQSKLVEYRFFGGLTYDEIADVTGLSVATVKRDWQRARTWLYRAMQDDASRDDDS